MFAKAKVNIGKMVANLHTDYYEGLKSLGEKIFKKDDLITDPSIHFWLPTGIWPLDLNISRGNGLPGGKVVEIFGRSKVGKSTLALEFVRQAQAQGGRGEWFDFEAAMSIRLGRDMQQVKMDNDELWGYRQPLETEKSLDYVEALIRWHTANSQKPMVIVIDSVPAMVALGEREKSMGDNATVSNNAAIMARFLPRILGLMARGNVYLILINQVRSKVDTNRGKGSGHNNSKRDYSTPGGNAIEFFSHLRLELFSESIEVDSEDEPIGSLVRCRTDKSRIDTPYRECLYPIYFRDDQLKQGIDDAMANLIYLISRQILKSSGNGRFRFSPDDKWDFKETLRARYYTDDPFRKEVQDRVKDCFEQENKIGKYSKVSLDINTAPEASLKPPAEDLPPEIAAMLQPAGDLLKALQGQDLAEAPAEPKKSAGRPKGATKAKAAAGKK